MIRLLKRIEAACAWPGKQCAWAVPLLVLCVCLSVLMVQLKWNVLFQWNSSVPLFDKRLSMGGLVDFQWHLFAVIIMLGGIYALHEDSHVSVDFLADRFSDKTRKSSEF